MLTVRSEQLAVLGQDVDRRFVDDMVRRFALQHPGLEPLRDRVVAARARGAAYGITGDDDVRWFVQLDLQRGPEWELQPQLAWARDILSNAGSGVAGRRFRLEKWLERWDRHGE